MNNKISLNDAEKFIAQFKAMLNGELGNKIPAISKPYLFSAREDAPSNFDQEYGVHFGCKCDSVIYFLLNKCNDILYIGETGAFGWRMNNHLQYIKNPNTNADFRTIDAVCVIVMDGELRCFRRALEHYLISQIKPSQNTHIPD
jgi:hypothetical protein